MANQRISQLYKAWPAEFVWNRAVQQNDQLSCTVATLRKSLTRSQRLNTIEEEYTPLSRLFMPIPANPSDKVRTELIVNTFVWSLSGYDTMNYNEAAVDSFVQQTIDTAKHFRDLRETQPWARATASANWCLVLGEKGIGKSHLQNYIISKYSDDFDKHKILWVRINLIRDYGDDESLHLNDWVHAQIAKILFRYYDPKSEFRTKNRPKLEADYKSRLRRYIDSGNFTRQEKNELGHQLNTMMTRFQEKNKDQDLDPSWVSTVLADEIVAMARRDGFCFVVVIDGLDLLSLSVTAGPRYQRREKAVELYLNAETRTDSFVIVFQRPESVEQSVGLQRIFDQQQNTPYATGLRRRYYVGATTGRQLYDARIAYAAKGGHAFNISTENIREFTEFIKNEASGLLDEDGKSLSYLQAITSLSHINARGVMQLLSIATLKQSAGLTKNYRLTEMAMLGNLPYPPLAYKYLLKNKQLYRISAPDHRQFDVLHLPSLFEFPYHTEERTRRLLKTLGVDAYMWGIRILQVVLTVNRLEESGVQVSVLRDVLDVVFGYPPDRTYLMIEEFVEFELLYLERSNDSRVRHWEKREVVLSPKGRLLLDFYIYDVTYLGIAAMTAPMPASILYNKGRSRSLFGRSSVRDGVVDWVQTKLKNSFALSKLVASASRRQQEKLEQVRPDDCKQDGTRQIVELIQSSETSVKDISSRLEKTVTSISEKVYRGIEKKADRDKIVTELRADLDSWDDGT